MLYNILSPDGFTIYPEDFETPEAAEAAFTQWKLQYDRQGYYSSNSGRIFPEDLRGRCQLVSTEDGGEYLPVDEDDIADDNTRSYGNIQGKFREEPDEEEQINWRKRYFR